MKESESTWTRHQFQPRKAPKREQYTRAFGAVHMRLLLVSSHTASRSACQSHTLMSGRQRVCVYPRHRPLHTLPLPLLPPAAQTATKVEDVVQVQAEAKEPWSLPQSIFKPRSKESDARDFFDGPAVCARCRCSPGRVTAAMCLPNVTLEDPLMIQRLIRPAKHQGVDRAQFLLAGPGGLPGALGVGPANSSPGTAFADMVFAFSISSAGAQRGHSRGHDM